MKRVFIFAIILSLFCVVTQGSIFTIKLAPDPSWLPMTKQQISDTLGNGEFEAAWEMEPGSTPGMYWNVDATDSKAPIVIHNHATSGITGTAALQVYLHSGLEGLAVHSDASDEPWEYYTGGGDCYIVFDSTKGMQEIKFTAPMDGSDFIWCWKWFNHTNTHGELFPQYNSGDDFVCRFSGNDSVYFDHLSGDVPFNAPTLCAGWPATGDTLKPYVEGTGLSGSVINNDGKQGEAIWLYNENGGASALGWQGSPLCISNFNSTQAGLVIKSNYPWGPTVNGVMGGNQNQDPIGIGLRIDDMLSAKAGSPTGYILPAWNRKVYSIKTGVGELLFGKVEYDTMHVNGHAKFNNDIVMADTSQFYIPTGTSWPTPVAAGSLFLKSTGGNDTLGVYNGASWLKFTP